MMSFEGTPRAAALDPAVVEELRTVLSHAVQTGDHSAELKGLLARAAADARQKGIHAEQLLVSLKDIWYSLPALSPHGEKATQTRLLQQLVARCIQEYYAS